MHSLSFPTILIGACSLTMLLAGNAAAQTAAPVVSISASQTLEVGAGCVADATITATATDADTSDTQLTFNWYVSAAAFSQMQSYQMSADGYTSRPANSPTATKNFGSGSQTYVLVASTASHTYTDTFPEGTTQVIAEVVDPEGNSGTAMTTIIVQDTVAPTLVWMYGTTAIPDGNSVTFTVSQLPVTLTVDSFDYCSSILDKTYTTTGGTATLTYTTTSYTITSATAGTTINLYAQAHDDSDNYSPSQAVSVIIQADPVVSGKRNEGLGNGVDGNTPGHLHNGGNDDPQFRPGNPGARNKNK